MRSPQRSARSQNPNDRKKGRKALPETRRNPGLRLDWHLRHQRYRPPDDCPGPWPATLLGGARVWRQRHHLQPHRRGDHSHRLGRRRGSGRRSVRLRGPTVDALSNRVTHPAVRLCSQPRLGRLRIGTGQKLVKNGIRNPSVLASRHLGVPMRDTNGIPDSPTVNALGVASRQQPGPGELGRDDPHEPPHPPRRVPARRWRTSGGSRERSWRVSFATSGLVHRSHSCDWFGPRALSHYQTGRARANCAGFLPRGW